MKKAPSLLSFGVGLALATGVSANEISTKNNVNQTLKESKSITFMDDNGLVEKLKINNAKEEEVIVNESRTMHDVIMQRIRELDIIYEAGDAITKIEDNEVAMNEVFNIDPKLALIQEDFFFIRQQRLAEKIVELYMKLPEDPDMCFIMGKYLYDHSKNKTKAIEYFSKSLSKSTKYLDPIHLTLFSDLIYAIKNEDNPENNKLLVHVVKEFDKFIKPVLADAMYKESDPVQKKKFEYFLEIINPEETQDKSSEKKGNVGDNFEPKFS